MQATTLPTPYITNHLPFIAAALRDGRPSVAMSIADDITRGAYRSGDEARIQAAERFGHAVRHAGYRILFGAPYIPFTFTGEAAA